MTKKAQAITLSSILIIVIYLSFKLPKLEAERINAKHELGIGSLINHGMKTIDIGYEYQGKHHIYTCGIPFLGLQEGEQYAIKIYKDNPDRILINLDEPIIDSINSSWKTIQPMETYRIPFNDDEVKFSYSVNGIKYTRVQIIKKRDGQENINKYVLKYREDKPEISYLLKKEN